MPFRKIIKWGVIGAGSLMALFLLVLLSLEFFISDSYVASLVSRFSGNWLTANLKVEKIHFSTFSHFPHVGIELENGEIITQTNISPAKADTLLQFDNFTLLFNPIKLLMRQVDIQGIKLSAPKMYGYISQDGEPNWNIFKEEPENTADTLEKPFSFNINVRNISIKERGYFVFDNREDAFRASLFLNSFDLQGRFSNDIEKIRIRKGYFSRVNFVIAQSGVKQYISQFIADSSLAQANRASLRFSVDTLNMDGSRGHYGIEARTRTNIRLARNAITENLPLDIKGNISISRRGEKGISLEDMKIHLAGIPLNLNGNIEYKEGKLHTENLLAKIEEFPLEEFIKYIPEAIVPQKEKVNTNAHLSVDASIYGTYDAAAGELPSANITIGIPHSYIGFKGRKEKIKDLHLNATYHFRGDNPDSNMVRINSFGIDGTGITAKADGTIKGLMEDPYINLNFGGYLNLDSALQILPAGTDIYGSGIVEASVDVKSRLSNLTPYNLAKTNLKGNIKAKNINAGIPSKKIYCTLYGGEIKAGSAANTHDTTIKAGTRMIGLYINIDSTYIRYADSLIVKGRSIKFNGHNEASLFDTTSKVVKPFNGTLSASSFELRGADSTTLAVRSTTNKFSILPHKGNMEIPSIHLNSNSRRILFRQDVNFISVTNGTFDLQAHRNDAETKMRETRINRLTDSLQIIYPEVARDSLMKHWIKERGKTRRNNNTPDDFAQEDYNFKITDKGVLYILNRWAASGIMNANRIRIATPAFPLRTRIEGPEMTFSLNEVKVNKAAIYSGHSSFSVSGNINGIKNALSRGGKLRARILIDADTLNFNELANAIAQGEEYMSTNNSFRDTLMKVSSEDSLEEIIAMEGGDTISRMALVIVPQNIEAQIDLNVHYGVYSSIILHSAKGKLNSNNRCLQILDFNANTSAGAMDLNAFYKTKSKEELSVGFDLQFKDMDMGEFIKLYPKMDTLLPMLKSFEGIINSQIAATSQIDTNMNLKLHTIKGVARVRGDSLVLLDGETFAEIAKMMKFKNRERNLVDSIAVEVSIKDNQIEVFPFIMKMDRYTTAISGTQDMDMDMNFNYHISVLKSPIPMRMGINIDGNMDDFKFKIGKALYKDTKLPVYSKIIDSTRINLAEQIRHIYKTTD